MPPPAPTEEPGGQRFAIRRGGVQRLSCFRAQISQQKVCCCQALVSGGALLTLHLLPSVPALSPRCPRAVPILVRTREQRRDQEGARGPAEPPLPLPSITPLRKTPISLLKTNQDVAFWCVTEDGRTSPLPPGARLQYVNKAKAEFSTFLIIFILFHDSFHTEKWRKTPSVRISAARVPGFSAFTGAVGGARGRPSSSSSLCLFQPAARWSSLPDSAFILNHGTCAGAALNPAHVAARVMPPCQGAGRAGVFKDPHPTPEVSPRV